MDGRSKYGRSYWYEPGDWSLPKWWTDNPPVRQGESLTHAEMTAFYAGPFVRNVLGHKGGITTLPKI